MYLYQRRQKIFPSLKVKVLLNSYSGLGTVGDLKIHKIMPTLKPLRIWLKFDLGCGEFVCNHMLSVVQTAKYAGV